MNDEELRDLFAGIAMHGLIAKRKRKACVAWTAQLAYDLADEMLIAKRIVMPPPFEAQDDE